MIPKSKVKGHTNGTGIYLIRKTGFCMYEISESHSLEQRKYTFFFNVFDCQLAIG